MKFVIFGVLAFCLVLTNAAVIDPLDFCVRTMKEYTLSLQQKAGEVSIELEAKYDELITQPIKRVDESVNAIEARKEESEECFEKQRQEVENVVREVENSFDSCSQVAATSTKNIVDGIYQLITELVYDSIKLANGIKKCRSYENSSLKSACYATETSRALLLEKKAKLAIQDINQTVDESIPQVLEDFEQCSVNAEQYANAQLDNINNAFDSCIVVVQ